MVISNFFAVRQRSPLRRFSQKVNLAYFEAFEDAYVTGERPFQCTWCSYSAVLNYQLTHHLIAKHGGEKRFKCEHCSYASVQKSTLTQHVMAKHTDERPFQCSQCCFAAAKKSDLSRHVKVKHTE